MQREIIPRVSLDVGDFRRVWSNFRVTDNLNLAADDFDTFSMVVPKDTRLPGGGGQTLDGLVALKPSAFGRPTRNDNRLDSVYGKQIEHWDAVDVSVDNRLANGLTLQVGTSTGKTTENDCDIMNNVPEFQDVNLGGVTALRPRQYCDRATPFLTQFKRVRGLDPAESRRAGLMHVPQRSRRCHARLVRGDQRVSGRELHARASAGRRRGQHEHRYPGAERALSPSPE
ncbi:MAG: hypothetical protein ABL961_08795 [Vicinamibacterales bacterium]